MNGRAAREQQARGPPNGRTKGRRVPLEQSHTKCDPPEDEQHDGCQEPCRHQWPCSDDARLNAERRGDQHHQPEPELARRAIQRERLERPPQIALRALRLAHAAQTIARQPAGQDLVAEQ
jgi:hypothetical protein